MSRSWPFVLILLWTGIAHGLLLLNDGVYWDGWLYHTAARLKDWEVIIKPYTECGYPWFAYLHWFIAHMPGIDLAYRLTGFATLLIFGSCLFGLLDRARLTTREESLWITLLAVSHPVFQILIAQVTVPYLFQCLGSFSVASLLAVSSEKSTGTKHLMLRIAALLFFVLSFGIPLFMPYFYGFLVFLFLVHRQTARGALHRVFGAFLLRHVDYCILPFLVWFASNHFFPRTGAVYGDVYAFKFSPSVILASASNSLCTGVYAQLNLALRQLLAHPLLLVVAVPLFVRLRKVSRGDACTSATAGAKPLPLAAFSIVLLGLAMLPFAAVGDIATPEGWGLRHAILLPVPLALLVVTFAKTIRQRADSRLSTPASVLLLCFLLGLTLKSADSYVAWQARWVKDRSVMANLKDVPRIKDYSVLWVNDEIPRTFGETYRFLEWAGMLKSVFGDESILALDLQRDTEEFLEKGDASFSNRHAGLFLSKYWYLENVDPAGRQATLHIKAAPKLLTTKGSNLKLVSLYYFYKFLDGKQLEPFLRSLTTLTIEPVTSSTDSVPTAAR